MALNCKKYSDCQTCFYVIIQHRMLLESLHLIVISNDTENSRNYVVTIVALANASLSLNYSPRILNYDRSAPIVVQSYSRALALLTNLKRDRIKYQLIY